MEKLHTSLIQDYEEKLPIFVECLYNTIGRKRFLLILLHLRKYNKLRNKELAKQLGKISSSTLSSLLKQLNREGLINRHVYGEIPPISTEYSLTKRGKDLLNAIDPLLNWLYETKVGPNFQKRN